MIDIFQKTCTVEQNKCIASVNGNCTIIDSISWTHPNAIQTQSKSNQQPIENLIVFSREIKIPRNDLEYMSINTIQNAYNYLGVEKIRKQINNEIQRD